MFKVVEPMNFKIVWICCFSLICSGVMTRYAQGSNISTFFNRQTTEHIEKILSENPLESYSLASELRLVSNNEVSHLYQMRGFSPLWFDGWFLKEDVEVLMHYLREAGAHGLCGDDYLLPQLEGLVGLQKRFQLKNLPIAPDSRAILDLLLSQAFLTFTTHMVEGQVDPNLTHVDWRARGRKADLVKLLSYAINSNKMEQVLEDLLPPHAEYRKMVKVLERYQEISAAGGWPLIPPGVTIHPGDHDPRVVILKTRLHLSGDLVEINGGDSYYDQESVDAVKRFQMRHGLVDDGVVGSKTFAVMNVSVERRIRQIELNLERWRWMPRSFGKRHIRINVADFTLDVVEDGLTIMQMPVIVGTLYRKTPVFNANMTYLEFAPYWVVPPTIFREDKLPLIKKDPSYLEKKHYKILSNPKENIFIDPEDVDWKNVVAEKVPWFLRMEPGPWNPLGRVKFIFPNRFNVYLHDTNEKELFKSNVRLFSSGCIRVERPRELAFYLLQDQLGADQLDQLLSASAPKRVFIKPFPVHVQYWTAWVAQDDIVHFRPDVHFRDLDLEVALNEPEYRVIEQLQSRDAASL